MRENYWEGSKCEVIFLLKCVKEKKRNILGKDGFVMITEYFSFKNKR